MFGWRIHVLRSAVGYCALRLPRRGSRVPTLQIRPFSVCSVTLAWETRVTDTSQPQSVFLSGYESIEQLEKASEDIKKIFDLQFASKRERNKYEMAKIVDKYKSREGDTGSAEVQVATLSFRISELTKHLQEHRKDKDCLRILIQLLQRRKKLLLILKEFNPNSYHYLLSELKLREPVVTSYQYKKRKKKRRMERKRKKIEFD